MNMSSIIIITLFMQIYVNSVPLIGIDYHASNSSVVLPVASVLQPIFNRCDIRNVSTVLVS